MLTWNVKNYDINKHAIIDYDVLKYRQESIKALKKKCASKVDFAEALKRDFRWQYWCRSEYELILSITEDRIILSPWVGSRKPEVESIDVTEDTSFDWHLLAAKVAKEYGTKDMYKIDVWDQLSIRFDEIVDYCWYTRLLYERDHPKFHEE